MGPAIILSPEDMTAKRLQGGRRPHGVDVSSEHSALPQKRLSRGYKEASQVPAVVQKHCRRDRILSPALRQPLDVVSL